MTWPKFSIVMATFNSMRTVEQSLKSIRDLDYPSDQIEILVVDGGSTDGTRELAVKFNCRVLDNPKVEPVNAKLIGLREASGRYLMHVDSDEVLTDKMALKTRVKIFSENPELKMIFSSGYKNPPNAPFAARYINEYGDPYSMFYYRLSKDYRFFEHDITHYCRVHSDQSEYVILEVVDGNQPIMENAACANCIDLEFFRKEFSELCDKPWGPVHFFYHMQKFTKKFAITKGDPVLHYSADHWRGFLKKIKWRIRNNIFFIDQLGASGFSGRVLFESRNMAIKKYAFLPYAFLLAPVLLDAFVLVCSRRDISYVLHVPLTLYTATMIVAMSVAKIFGYKPAMASYGGQAIKSGVNPK